ncbi:TadE/TadG family type IV pilus assembly protein [Spirillospora sp. NPDC047279]|uniref:TadE/TadG family type IV pilus assembly protein n=1 Tax=Spirillospora sp. NPDC047279 TaxID=3155478 RepID=UPI0033FCD392
MRTHRQQPPGAGDRGAAAAELTLITPLLVLLLLLLVASARLVSARQKVNDAAHQAARAASIAPDSASATAAAEVTARTAIAQGGVSCQNLDVTAETSGFRPGGQIDVHVSCSVALSDLSMLSLPGNRSINARFTAPIDQWRSSAP